MRILHDLPYIRKEQPRRWTAFRTGSLIFMALAIIGNIIAWKNK